MENNWLTSVQYDVNKLTHQAVRKPRLDTSAAAASLQVKKWIDALEESKQICSKRFVIALILIADLFFHKRLKSETPNRHFKAHPGIFRFVTFNLCPVP